MPLKRLGAYLDLALKRASWLGALVGTMAVTLMAILIGIEVIARQAFNAPFIDTVLIGRMSLIFIIYLGMGWVMRENRHIAADFVVVRLPPRVRMMVEGTAMLVALVAIGVITIETASFAFYALQTGEQVLGRYTTPAFPFQIAITIGFALLGLEVVRSIVLRMIEVFSGKPERLPADADARTSPAPGRQGEQ